MGSSIVLAFLGLLTGLVPLILQVGTYLIGKFISGEDAQAQALSNFYTAIQAHASDALQSVLDRQNYQDQLGELNKQTEDTK